MKNTINKNRLFFFFAIIVLAGGFAILNLIQTEGNNITQQMEQPEAIIWNAEYREADFSSSEIRELVRQLHDATRSDRDPDVLRPVIIQLGVHLRQSSDPVPLIVADLLRDLSVEHPVKDIRLMAYSTMITALQNEAGVSGSRIGFAAR